MPTVHDLLNEGDLPGATALSRELLADRPDDHGLRFSLILLLATAEQWPDAVDELAELGRREPQIADGVELLDGLIRSSMERHHLLLSGRGNPAGLSDPPEWASDFFTGLQLLTAGDPAASVTYERAHAVMPDVRATVNGQTVSGLRDADDRLAPFLEAVVPGAYLWLPWEQVRKVTFETARGFQDMIWRPMEVEMADGTEGRLWMPMLYPGSSARQGVVAVGHVTEFHDALPGVTIAWGTRDFRAVHDDAEPGTTTLFSGRVVESIVVEPAGPA